MKCKVDHSLDFLDPKAIGSRPLISRFRTYMVKLLPTASQQKYHGMISTLSINILPQN